MNEPTLKTKEMRNLYKVLLSVKTEAEMKNLLRDLCTISELEAMAERLQVVEQVEQGIPYRKISENTGASTATITRVAHWLKHGMGGYRLMLDRSKK